MVTPDPPFINHPKAPEPPPETQPEKVGRRTPPWEIARRIALSPQPSFDDPWRINSDPNVADLAATMNPFVGLIHKAAAPREREAAQEPTSTTLRSINSTDPQKDRVVPGPAKYGSRQSLSSRGYSTQADTLADRSSTMGTPPPAFLKQGVVGWRQQLACVALALVAALSSLLLLSESFQTGSAQALQRFGLLTVLLSGLTGAPLAYMCYSRIPHGSRRAAKEATRHASSTSGDPGLEFLSTRLTAKGFAVVKRSQELHADLLLNALKALAGFLTWNVMRTYASLSPAAQGSISVFNSRSTDPPLFGPAPFGARIGIAGYPSRHGREAYQRLTHASWLPLFLSLLADGTRLLGLWFSLRMFRQGKPEEHSSVAPPSRWPLLGGGRQLFLLLLVAVPVASVALKQAFWSSNCQQSLTEAAVLFGGPHPALAALALRCHSVLLAVAAAMTGAVLAAALGQLSNKFSRSTSKVLGLMAALALLCCIVFDVLAAASPSADFSTSCTLYTFEDWGGSYAFKAFTAAAMLARLLALVCLSGSASNFGIKDKVLSAALDQQPIDESLILGAELT
ncbi:hypothetical protein Efla_002908 [Eimeria flavescens]